MSRAGFQGMKDLQEYFNTWYLLRNSHAKKLYLNDFTDTCGHQSDYAHNVNGSYVGLTDFDFFLQQSSKPRSVRDVCRSITNSGLAVARYTAEN